MDAGLRQFLYAGHLSDKGVEHVRKWSKVAWIAGAWLLVGCDQLADKYRVEFRDGSWREIAITPFSDEAR